MKTSELIKRVMEIEGINDYSQDEGMLCFYGSTKGGIVAHTNKIKKFELSTDCASFSKLDSSSQELLLVLLYQYAMTPIEKREEPTISERSAISVDNKDIYALQWKDVLSTENISNHGLFQSVEEAIKSIRMWWELNDYTSPYIRYWESKPGTTKIDYGSHRYFYYITKVDKDNFQSVIYHNH